MEDSSIDIIPPEKKKERRAEEAHRNRDATREMTLASLKSKKENGVRSSSLQINNGWELSQSINIFGPPWFMKLIIPQKFQLKKIPPYIL